MREKAPVIIHRVGACPWLQASTVGFDRMPYRYMPYNDYTFQLVGERDSTRLKVKGKQTLPFCELNRKQTFLRGRTLRVSFLEFSITDAGVRVGF